MSLVTRTPLALEIGHRDLPNRVNYDAVCHGVYAFRWGQMWCVLMGNQGLQS